MREGTIIVRSKLFVPGHRPEFFEKARTSEAGMVTFDLEDGVPSQRKAEDRSNVRTALGRSVPNGQRLGVRVNPPGSGHFVDDLRAVVRPNLDEIHLPKVRGPEDVRMLDALLSDLESKHGLTGGTVGIIPTLESPEAIERATEIALASPRVCALQLGLADLSAAVGMEMHDQTLMYVRMKLALASARAGVPVIDSAFLNYKDLERFRYEAESARRFGFRGKSCIHPTQIAVANEVFSPTEDEIDEAMAILDRWTKQNKETFAVSGGFVDLPVIKKAQQTIEVAVRLERVDEERVRGWRAASSST